MLFLLILFYYSYQCYHHQRYSYHCHYYTIIIIIIKSSFVSAPQKTVSTCRRCSILPKKQSYIQPLPSMMQGLPTCSFVLVCMYACMLLKCSTSLQQLRLLNEIAYASCHVGLFFLFMTGLGPVIAHAMNSSIIYKCFGAGPELCNLQPPKLLNESSC